MKKLIFFMLTFMLLVTPVLFSQPSSTYDLEGTELTAFIPENWEVTREHLLLLLMPKAKDITMKIEITDEADMANIVKASMEEIKNVLPNDTCCIVYDIEINNITCKEIKFISKDKHIVCYTLFKSPAGKIVKVSIIEKETICDKYENDLKLIKNGIKKKI